MKLVTAREAPAGRASYCDGPLEQHLTEAGVMLAIAEWMFRCGAEKVDIHPDGMHAKYFDICGWLESVRFEKVAPIGKTRVAGHYKRDHQNLTVDFRPGQGDVVGDVQGHRVVVEAKGGCINTRHSGQVSHLRKRLYEAVGQLLGGEYACANQLIAAVPRCTTTEQIVKHMARRCSRAGIQIALVSDDGAVEICA